MEAQEWLRNHGFATDDLRREIDICVSAGTGTTLMCPMAAACHEGNEDMCEWLYDHGASADITRVGARNGWTPMLYACERGHLKICEWLFEVGAGADVTRAEHFGVTPMLWACQAGHLPICEWLFDMGAADHITKAMHGGFTPMHVSSRIGNLAVCQWLFNVGAARDITKADDHGRTPMYSACEGGHLEVCQWLFDVGAAEDITRANNNGATPMLRACIRGHLLVCQWLVLNGALNDPTNHHVDPTIVNIETINGQRPALLEIAQTVLYIHRTFYRVVLRGSVILPARQRNRGPSDRCHLPLLPRPVLERVGVFIGVEKGRRLRNMREFSEALVSFGVEVQREKGQAASSIFRKRTVGCELSVVLSSILVLLPCAWRAYCARESNNFELDPKKSLGIMIGLLAIIPGLMYCCSCGYRYR